MTNDDKKLLQIFDIRPKYFTLTREIVKEMYLYGDVKFVCNSKLYGLAPVLYPEITRAINGVLVMSKPEGIDIVTNAEKFKLPKNSENMFSGCKVRSFNFENVDTSEVENMKCFFYKCEIEKEIKWGTFNTSTVENMNSMFRECKISALDLGCFNTSKVTDMSYMFSDSGVKVINLKSFNTSKVTDMSGMFANCSINDLNLSSFNTSNVTSMRSMFHEFRGRNINISSFRTPKLKNMGCMFYNCYTDTIDIHNFDTRNVYTMQQLFYNCQVKYMIIDNLNLNNVQNRDDMFTSMEVLRSISSKNLKCSLGQKAFLNAALHVKAYTTRNESILS